MEIKTVFKNLERIPEKYTCDGIDVNPEIEIINPPKETISFVFIIDDPDAPRGDWVHWIIYNIPNFCNKILENSVPKDAKLGMNDFKKTEYGGPCPPSGNHRYFFKLYSIDKILNFSNFPKKSDILQAIENHIIEKAEIIGTYSRR